MAKSTNEKRKFNYVKDYVLFDLETTGISAAKDSVIEISAVKVADGKVVDEFSSLVNPQRPIPYAASMVNGITDDMVKDQPTFDIVLADFLAFAGDNVLVGHNIHSFDMKFLYRDAKQYLGIDIENEYVDTLSMARLKLPQLSHHKLVDLAEYYGISSEGAHRALNDCRMNQAVFEKLGKEKGQTPAKGQRICPRCQMRLVKRSGRYGEFWGCTGFPNCSYTENAVT